MSDLFQEIILDEAKHPANYGTLTGTDLKQVHYNPSCGDTIQVTIKINDENKTVEDLKWTGEGCTISMATMSLLSKEVIGKKITDVLKIDQDFLLGLLDLESITPGRIKCMMIGLRAVQDLLSTVR
ncbi:MAG: iron-sulfur cluster assembly scaffold protein [Candidatus Pacebacteria bacterium]|nr:iron-sulfur cluster assembly scaffold protein [Candidatus Paceibacterota bacterium]